MPYPEPPPQLNRLTPSNAIRFMGPGLIVASVTIGSGELVWASRSGAIFGTAMLWVFLFAGIFKALQVYSSARHFVLTGEHPLSAWQRNPLLRGWFPIALIAVPSIFAMPLLFSGIAEAIGFYLLQMLGFPESGPRVAAWAYNEFAGNVAATLILGGCLLLSIATSLRLLEKISSVIIAILLISVSIAALFYSPNIIDILSGLVPSFPDFQPWVQEKYPESMGNKTRWSELALYLIAVGGGTYDYIGYVGFTRYHCWGLAGNKMFRREQLQEAIENDSKVIQRAKIWTRAPLMDVTVSFTLVIGATILFAILGSVVLHPQQVIPAGNELLGQQENFLAQLNPHLVWIFRVGVIFAFIGTLYGAYAIFRQTAIEALYAIFPERSTDKAIDYTKLATNLYCFFGGVILMWLPQAVSGNIADRIVLSAIICGAFTCGIWCFAMLIINRTDLPKALRMGRSLWISLLIAGSIMSYLGLRSIIEYFAN